MFSTALGVALGLALFVVACLVFVRFVVPHWRTVAARVVVAFTFAILLLALILAAYLAGH
jgi:hypothetical protein